MWLECALWLDCESWSLDLSHEALLPSGTGWMKCRVWTPLWTCWVCVWGDTCSSCSHCWTTLCYSPVTLSSDLLSPSKPCSGWLWSHLVPLRGLGWLSIWHSIAQVNPGLLCLFSHEKKSISHQSMQLGSGIGSCVLPSTLRKWNQDVPVSVSHRLRKNASGWRNVKDDLSAARSPVCSFLQGQGRGRRCSVWTFWV